MFNYDLLRGIAIILVAVQHAWSMSNMDTDEWGLLCYGYRTFVNCGVPLFVIMSGALLLDAPIRPFGEYFKRRFTRILYPFLLWAIVVYLISFLTHKYDEIITWKDFFVNLVPYLLNNKINDFHWFVHMILALYLIAPFLQRAFSLCDRKALDCLLLGWLLVMLLRSFCPDIYMLKYTTGLFPYLGCFIAGYYIRHYCYGRLLRWGPLVGILLFAILDIVTETRLLYVEFLMAISLFALFSVRPMNRQPSGSALMIFLSRYSYMIYLIHIPIIRALMNMLCSYHSPDNPGWIVFQPLWLAGAALSICVIGCWILEHIRLSGSVLKVLGITQNPKCVNEANK